MEFKRATKPTMYFIGVTTTKSSIMKLFPLWAEALGLGDVAIKGIDLPIHASDAEYREVVDFIARDELSLGALVTTHKIDLYNAAKDMFEELDPYATTFGELSSISKRDGKLVGHAKDPISSGLAMEQFIPHNYWSNHGGELFVMGAGGSAIAICSYLLNPQRSGNVPTRLVVANRSEPRLREIERIVNQINPEVPASYHLTPHPVRNDNLLRDLKSHSLIINATGLGKDRPGSPLTDACEFPNDSLVWELNYRGTLEFIHQAYQQQQAKRLYVEDGWIYFIHGWTQVIAEVFHIDIDADRFKKIEEISSLNK